MADFNSPIKVPIKKLYNTEVVVTITSEFKRRAKIAKALLRLAAWILGASITFELPGDQPLPDEN